MSHEADREAADLAQDALDDPKVHESPKVDPEPAEPVPLVEVGDGPVPDNVNRPQQRHNIGTTPGVRAPLRTRRAGEPSKAHHTAWAVVVERVETRGRTGPT